MVKSKVSERRIITFCTLKYLKYCGSWLHEWIIKYSYINRISGTLSTYHQTCLLVKSVL